MKPKQPCTSLYCLLATGGNCTDHCLLGRTLPLHDLWHHKHCGMPLTQPPDFMEALGVMTMKQRNNITTKLRGTTATKGPPKAGLFHRAAVYVDAVATSQHIASTPIPTAHALGPVKSLGLINTMNGTCAWMLGTKNSAMTWPTPLTGMTTILTTLTHFGTSLDHGW
jgi:hypothetical protein